MTPPVDHASISQTPVQEVACVSTGTWVGRPIDTTMSLNSTLLPAGMPHRPSSVSSRTQPPVSAVSSGSLTLAFRSFAPRLLNTGWGALASTSTTGPAGTPFVTASPSLQPHMHTHFDLCCMAATALMLTILLTKRSWKCAAGPEVFLVAVMRFLVAVLRSSTGAYPSNT